MFHKNSPLVHMPSYKSTRGITRSPVDFREGKIYYFVFFLKLTYYIFSGRRASDGLVGQQQPDTTSGVVAFNSQKFNEHQSKTKGVLDMHLVQREAQRLQSQYQAREHPEEISHRQKQHNQYLHPRGPKRVSLPDNFSYTTVSTEPQLHTAMQHRILQQKRQILQKQSALNNQTASTSVETAHAISRRQMLRQASYKIAQQQTVMPPLPLTENESQDLMAFQALVENSGENAWSALPGTMQNSCQISETSTLPTANWTGWTQVSQT